MSESSSKLLLYHSLLVLLLLPLTAASTESEPATQYHISGVVTDGDSGEPIQNAIVYVHGADRRILTDASGFFRIYTPDSLEYGITAFCYGYRSCRDNLTATSSGLSVGEVTLEPEPADQRRERSASDSYMRGWEIAQRELAKGVGTMYTVGLSSWQIHQHYLTGLPTRPIAGCIVTDSIDNLTAGHNDCVFHYIRESGFPHCLRWWRFQNWNSLMHFYRNEVPDSQKQVLRCDGDSVGNAEASTYLRLTEWMDRSLLMITDSAGWDGVFVDDSVPIDSMLIAWGPPELDVVILLFHERTFCLLDLIQGKVYCCAGPGAVTYPEALPEHSAAVIAPPKQPLIKPHSQSPSCGTRLVDPAFYIPISRNQL